MIIVIIGSNRTVSRSGYWSTEKNSAAAMHQLFRSEMYKDSARRESNVDRYCKISKILLDGSIKLELSKYEKSTHVTYEFDI